MRRLLPWLAALWLAAAWAPCALAQDGRYLLVVSGLGGEPYYSDMFRRWSLSLLDVALKRYAFDPGNIRYLAEDAAGGRANGISRKDAVLGAVDDIAARSAPGDRVLIVLIGHGTAQGRDARFNLPGPDLTPAELADALTRLDGRQLAVVNTAPASGAFLSGLSAPGRVVITATATAAEAQHTRFAGHFIDAMAGDAADTDKDGTVTLLEAFHAARLEVARAYRDDNRLATEHARLDDNGDGNGSGEPARDGADGRTAGRFHLAAAAGGEGRAAGAAVALQVEARRLVDRIERLKRDKRLLGDDEYETRLESLLVELALNRRAYRAEEDR
jgi:hypothetical protein